VSIFHQGLDGPLDFAHESFNQCFVKFDETAGKSGGSMFAVRHSGHKLVACHVPLEVAWGKISTKRNKHPT
jgi:hypothetical protein